MRVSVHKAAPALCQQPSRKPPMASKSKIFNAHCWSMAGHSEITIFQCHGISITIVMLMTFLSILVQFFHRAFVEALPGREIQENHRPIRLCGNAPARQCYSSLTKKVSVRQGIQHSGATKFGRTQGFCLRSRSGGGRHVCWLLRLLLLLWRESGGALATRGLVARAGVGKKYVPLDNMQPRCGLYHLRDFTRLQRKRSLLEFLLHVTFPEKSPTSHKWSAAVFPGTVETGLFFSETTFSSHVRQLHARLRFHRCRRPTRRRMSSEIGHDLQVASLPRRAAIAFSHGKLAKAGATTPDLLLVVLDDFARIFLGTGNLSLPP